MRLIPNWQRMREKYDRDIAAYSEASMTQTRLAELLGKDRSEISRYETGDRMPSLPLIVRACALLKCELVGTSEDAALYLLAPDCDHVVTEADDEAA